MNASASLPRSAVVLLAHGSRDAHWSAPIEAVARHARALDPQATVRTAYLEHTAPDLGTCVDDLCVQGYTDIHVLPMFLGLGGHVRQDLPRLNEALLAAHPGLRLHWQSAVGEQAPVTELLARLALQGLPHKT
jgi:sirohydrochlorin cobaltochelatase